MSWLNKKILQSSNVYKYLEELSVNQIILTIVTAIIIQANYTNQRTAVVIISLSLAILILILSEIDIRLSMSLLAVIAIGLMNVETLIIIASVILLIYALEHILLKEKKELSLLIIANLVHLGDALTTFRGLQLGNQESNILLIPLIYRYGYEVIFPVKALVIPLTVYPYLKFSSRTKIIYLKIVFAIGLYLTLNNIIVISS